MRFTAAELLSIDVRNDPGKIKKNVKKRKKRGKNKKTFKTLDKNVGHNVFNFLPNA